MQSVAQSNDTVQVDLVTTFTNGGSTLCVDIDVSNFDSMQLFQFTVRWNPRVATFREPYTFEFNDNIPLGDSTSINVNSNNISSGVLTLQWLLSTFDEAGLSLADGTTVLQFCFDLTGPPCSSTPIFLSNNPTAIEFVQSNGNIWTSDAVTASTEVIEITGSDLSIFARHCNASGSDDDGSINFYPCGGEEPFTWSFDGVPQSDPPTLVSGQDVQIENLSSGTYVIQVTDAAGNTSTRQVIVDEGVSPVEIVLDSRDPNCFYRSNGRITITDVVSDFAITETQWSNNVFDAQQIGGLFSGIYSVSVTDELGCVTSISDTLTVDTLRGSFTIVDSASCGGVPGIVNATATGGIPFGTDQYFFNSNFPSGFFLGPIDPGPFTINIRDDVGCEIDLSGVMPTRDSFTVDITTIDLTCSQPVASFDVAADGPFQFTFDVRNIDGSAFSDGSPSSTVNTYTSGDIDLAGADSLQLILTTTTTPNACEKMDTITLYGLDAVDIMAVVDNPGCDGTTGDIDLTISGGNGPYTFEWNDSVTTEDRIAIDAGLYLVTVTDVDGCTATDSYNILPGGTILSNIGIAEPVSCPGSTDATITVSPAPSDDYSFSWSTTLSGTEVANTQTVFDVGSGWYYVTISSNTQNCVTVDSIFVDDGSPIRFNVTPTPPTCATFTDGSLAITVTSGVAPYTYEWADDPTMDDSRSLLAGIGGGAYAVTISDAQGCMVDTTLNLAAPVPVFLLVTDIIDLDCSGQSTGEATASASGGASGTVSYSFLWSSGEVGSGAQHQATQLEPGTQWVIASDGVCVSDTIFFDIAGTPELSLSDATAIQLPRCINDCNGAIIAEGEGGQAPYAFTWQDDNSTTPNRTSLCAGTYVVEIEDATGCIDADTIVLPNPDSLIVGINNLTTIDLACGDALGQIGVAANGGADGGYMYDWSGTTATDPVVSGLDAGDYTITVTDQNGCSQTSSYTLSRPEELSFAFDQPSDPDCFGQMTAFDLASVAGGLGNQYSYSVDLGPLISADSATMLFAGEYIINVFDSSGRCSSDTILTITQPDPLEVRLVSPVIEIDLGEETNLISLAIDSDNPIDTIIWTPAESITCANEDCQTVIASPDSGETYRITVIDANGCVGEQELEVKVNTRRRVAFPNIFRPGSDRNGTFQIGIGNGIEQINYCRIYDRWGNLVWRQENYLPEAISIGGWDGTFKGSPAGTGVYTVIANISFTDGVDITYKRDLTLIK